MGTSTVDRRKGIPGSDAAEQVKAMGGPIAQRAGRKTADGPGFLDLRPKSQQRVADEQAVYRPPVVNQRQQATRSGQRPVLADMPGDEIVEGDPIAQRVSKAQKDGPDAIDLRARSTSWLPTGEVQATTDDLPDDDWTPRRSSLAERGRRAAAQRQRAGGDEPRTAPGSRSSRPGRRVHWFVLMFTGMVLLMILYTVCFWVYVIGLGISNRVSYGGPTHTSEVSADLGWGDSPANPSYVLASNVAGQIIVTILPGGDSTKARVYEVPALEPSIWGNLGDVVCTIEVQQHSANPNVYLHLVGDPGYWHFFARPSLTVTLINTKQGFKVLV